MIVSHNKFIRYTDSSDGLDYLINCSSITSIQRYPTNGDRQDEYLHIYLKESPVAEVVIVNRPDIWELLLENLPILETGLQNV